VQLLVKVAAFFLFLQFLDFQHVQKKIQFFSKKSAEKFGIYEIMILPLHRDFDVSEFSITSFSRQM